MMNIIWPKEARERERERERERDRQRERNKRYKEAINRKN